MSDVCGLMTGCTWPGSRYEGAMPKRSDLRITKRTVDAFRVEDGEAVFWDRDLPGFGVRVHATGRKSMLSSPGGRAASNASALEGMAISPRKRRGSERRGSSTGSSGARSRSRCRPCPSSPSPGWRSVICASTWRCIANQRPRSFAGQRWTDISSPCWATKRSAPWGARMGRNFITDYAGHPTWPTRR